VCPESKDTSRVGW